MSDRSRSASPRPKKQKTGGFKWKDKKPKDDDSAAQGSRDSGRLERGYRDRSPRRDSYRDRDREPERAVRSAEKVGDGNPAKEQPRRGTDSDRPTRTGDEARDGGALDSPAAKDAPAKSAAKPSKPKKERKPAAPSEPMIVVNVNDRLGTKAAIPCLASDTIKQFKVMVAAHIGRKPHEIMLKRQGMRAFKDHITLADYEISNGVQLDLELDTGD